MKKICTLFALSALVALTACNNKQEAAAEAPEAAETEDEILEYEEPTAGEGEEVDGEEQN